MILSNTIVLFILDVDECEVSTDNCDNQTTFCLNTFGNFDCLCLSGYINPNGTSCERELNLNHPINHCSLRSVIFSFTLYYYRTG